MKLDDALVRRVYGIPTDGAAWRAFCDNFARPYHLDESKNCAVSPESLRRFLHMLDGTSAQDATQVRNECEHIMARLDLKGWTVYKLVSATASGMTFGVHKKKRQGTVKILVSHDQQAILDEVATQTEFSAHGVAPAVTDVKIRQLPDGRTLGVVVMDHVGDNLYVAMCRARQRREVHKLVRGVVGLIGKLRDTGLVHGNLSFGNIVADRRGKLQVIDVGHGNRGARSTDVTQLVASSLEAGCPATRELVEGLQVGGMSVSRAITLRPTTSQ